jgi:hypothetical protein
MDTNSEAHDFALGLVLELIRQGKLPAEGAVGTSQDPEGNLADEALRVCAKFRKKFADFHVYSAGAA